MKAAYFEKHGDVDVIQYGDMPEPAVNASDVLIQVEACALNHLDIWARLGLPGISMPMPHISGADVCGKIIGLGSAVKDFSIGQKVIVSPGQLPLTEIDAYKGRDSYSPNFQILGLQSQGGYAQKVAVNEKFVILVSDKYSSIEWASIPLTAVTAYHMLLTRAALKMGETVLVHAAGSGVGVMAIQLAKYLGARVITTVGDRSKAEKAKALGADEVILYREKDFSEEVKSLTSGQGVDIIFEHIGPETWEKNLMCLKRGGRMVTCGATSGPKAEMAIRFLFSKQLSILGSYMGSLEELKQMLILIELGRIKPVVDSIFDLKDAALAQKHMEDRKNFGKILLTPCHASNH